MITRTAARLQAVTVWAGVDHVASAKSGAVYLPVAAPMVFVVSAGQDDQSTDNSETFDTDYLTFDFDAFVYVASSPGKEADAEARIDQIVEDGRAALKAAGFLLRRSSIVGAGGSVLHKFGDVLYRVERQPFQYEQEVT